MASYASAAIKQKSLQLDIRDYFHFFEAPTIEAIRHSVRNAIPDDSTVIVRPLPGKFVGVYQIYTISNTDNVKIVLPRKKEVGGYEDITIPLTPPSQHRGPREGTLITIVDGDVGDAHMIPDSDFDEVLKEYGEVISPARPQKYKDTDFFNGNLMVVVKRNDKPLPDRLLIKGLSLLLKYKGKVWNCSHCKVQHSGPCPYLKRFYELKNQRQEEGINHLIVSDSTLRLAEQVGLRADIACISGATVGQIAHAANHHSDGLTHQGVTIVAGANDVWVGDSFTELEVSKKVDRSLGRLKAVAKWTPLTTYTIINSSPPAGNDSPLQEFVRLYFKRRLENTCSEVSNLNLSPPTLYPEAWAEGHPTTKCTVSIIKNLATCITDLIIDPEFITSKGMYRGVTSGWRSGCSGCNTREKIKGKFCTGCLSHIKDPTQSPDDVELMEQIKADLRNTFGQLKRELSNDNSSDDDATCPKKPQFD